MKQKQNKMDPFKVKIALILVLTIIATSAITYGFFYANKNQSGKNDLVTKCFNIDLKDETDSIKLSNAFAISDEQGKTTAPYAVTITNTCDIDVAYHVVMDEKENSFASSHINTTVNGGAVQGLTAKTNTAYPAGDGYSASYVLSSGTLAKDESQTISIRLWMNAATTFEEVQGKNWEGRVRIVSAVSDVDNYINNN